MTRISDERLEELIKELPYAEHNDTERGPCIACDALLAVRELRDYRKAGTVTCSDTDAIYFIPPAAPEPQEEMP